MPAHAIAKQSSRQLIGRIDFADTAIENIESRRFEKYFPSFQAPLQ
jgi:hypothetical protein